MRKQIFYLKITAKKNLLFNSQSLLFYFSMSSSPHTIDVSYLARLARLQLTAKEETLFTEQLERVLEHIAKINKLDLSDIEPTAHAISVFDIVREDVVGKSLPKQVVLEQAPHQANGLFVVPKVLE